MALLDPRLYTPCSTSLLQMASDTAKLSCRRTENDKDGRVRNERPDLARVENDTQTAGEIEITDSILSALTQLGAFRLGCARAFTTILEGDVFRVIAEATPQTSAADDKSLDLLRLTGVVTFGLGGYRRQDHDASFPHDNCIIRDTRETMFALEGNPLLDRSQARFYAEVPLYNRCGKLIGTYGMVDKEPRTSFSSQDLADLYDIAKSIAAHLDTVAVQRRDAQSKLQLKALIAMSKGRDEFQTTDWEPRRGTSKSGCVSPHSSLPILQSLSRSHTAAQPIASSLTDNAGPSASHNLPSKGRDHESHQRHARKSSGRLRNSRVVVPEARSILPDVATVYAKAASLLQAGMDLDGAMFVDAPRVSSRLSSRRSSCSSLSEREENEKPNDSNRRSSAKLCDALGSALSERYPIKSQDRPSPKMNEGLVHDLFTAFPDGQVINAVQEISSSERPNQAVASGLFEEIPDASSLIFLPIWSHDKSKWLAATIVWSCNSQGSFQDDDLYYLKAFGDVIGSEIAQIDRTAVDRSKSDLLKSISHELRSPLHGMLANSELLQSTDLDPVQRDMVKMVETCGETLLDTMNCLLDFAKINNLTHAHKGSINTSAHLNSLTTEFDIGSLVEDVADSVYAGHQRLADATARSGCRPPEESKSNERGVVNGNKFKDLSVVVRVEEHVDWKIRSISGAWRRIIMNVFGNALKFTRSGFIEVALDQLQRKHHGRMSSFAHLTITDSGCGISQEYLDSKLFTPFSQESVLTDGTGLGMSITKQLVEYLGGHIEVKSELGTGTQVDIYVPVDFAEHGSLTDGVDNEANLEAKIPHSVCLIGLDPHVESHDTTQRLSSDTKRKLAIRSTISSLVLRQPGWKLSFTDSLDISSGDVVVMEQSRLRSAATLENCNSSFRSVIVLADNGDPAPHSLGFAGVEVLYIPQPIGPRKVIQALQSVTESQLSANSPAGTLIQSPTPTMPARAKQSSEVFDKPKRLDSPLAVRQSVSDYTHLPANGLSETLHVLIVDDNDINLKVLSTFLRKIGCTFETASDGLSALQKYKGTDQKFDYILMDISMPVMDGITSSSKIREYEEEHGLPRSAIMAVTGVASSETQEQAFAAGIDDYLVKPLSLHDLKRILSVPEIPSSTLHEP
ncbi:hypothetical protein BJX65DRAFT_194550 [Aspergillus insuetus]